MEFNTEYYFDKMKNGNKYWLSIVEEKNLETGVLFLQPGKKDNQSPHNKDEIYFILKGDGFLNINGTDYSVEENKLFFVKRNTNHFFHGNKTTIKSIYFLN